MIKKIIFGSIFLGLLSVHGFCQEQKQPLDNSSPLTLTIKSDKEVYGAGEEIKIEATIKNNSDKEMIVFWNDSRPAQASGGGGTTLLVQPTSMANVMYIKPKEAVNKIIIPGDSGPVFILNYDNSGMSIDMMHNSNQEIFTGTLTSNTITIEVVEKKEVKKLSDE